jgi:hypothetical protein
MAHRDNVRAADLRQHLLERLAVRGSAAAQALDLARRDPVGDTGRPREDGVLDRRRAGVDGEDVLAAQV